METTLWLNFAIALFAITNPLGKVPVWTELTGDKSPPVRRRLAFLVTGTTLLILLPFLAFGKQVLNLFTIDLASFQIAGGILVLLTAISMVQGKETQLRDREDDGDDVRQSAKNRFKRILVPMTIPMMAGPGTITTVMLFSVKAKSLTEYGELGIVLVASLLLTYFTLLLSIRIEGHVDPLVYTVFTRIFGLLLAGIAIQLMVEGLGQVFPNWLEGQSTIDDDVQSGG
jgi:multiple antibiotic resistance protein